jgi:L-seryl-tRNA(Ser) seleniumtransferase
VKHKSKKSRKRHPINKKNLRQIPSIDTLLNAPEIKEFLYTIDQPYVTALVRDNINEFRKRLIAGERYDVTKLKQNIVETLHDLLNPYFCYAINATGIVLHTGLGRAPVNKRMASGLKSLSHGYIRLQIGDDGRRIDRHLRINHLLHILTGAEAGMIVNNNAAATLLILNTLAKNREVIISRGQLIEIGGSFRIPEILAQSGAIMKEIGTTNRTHLKDYSHAINDNTAALLRVHQSNYRITGFTKQVSLGELVQLGKKHVLPVIDDLGSGALLDFSQFGLPKEPVAQESIKTGADIVCFSGDKLIGGPQCGIIIGKKKYIEQLKRNPLARVLRSDKFASALLETTLQLFLLHKNEVINNHSVLGMLLRPLPDIKRQAMRCAHRIKKQLATRVDISVDSSVSEIGGGSLSTEELPTYVVSIKSNSMRVDDLARALRKCRIPIFGRVKEGTLLLDFRTVLKDEEKFIIEAVTTILKTDKSKISYRDLDKA